MSARPQTVLKSRVFFAEFGAWQRATPAQRQLWAYCATVGRETVRHNRERILAHPDLAEQVRQLYGMQRPDQWSGFIPPERNEWPESSTIQPLNRSPYRAALLELLAEATGREAAP